VAGFGFVRNISQEKGDLWSGAGERAELKCSQVDNLHQRVSFGRYIFLNLLQEEIMEIFSLAAFGLAILVFLRWQIASAANKN